MLLPLPVPTARLGVQPGGPEINQRTKTPAELNVSQIHFKKHLIITNQDFNKGLVRRTKMLLTPGATRWPGNKPAHHNSNGVECLTNLFQKTPDNYESGFQ
jgi:hypothetical protein